MAIPNRVYYCPLHSTVKDKPGECAWYYANGKCMAISARDTDSDECRAIELAAMPKEISAELVNDIETMLEDCDNTDPPVDRTKLAVALIEKARGL